MFPKLSPENVLFSVKEIYDKMYVNFAHSYFEF
jgi:hypothetical protein